MLIIEQQQNVVVMNKNKIGGGIMQNIKHKLIKHNLKCLYYQYKHFIQKIENAKNDNEIIENTNKLQKIIQNLERITKKYHYIILVKNDVPYPITINEFMTFMDIIMKNKIEKLTFEQFHALIKFVEQKNELGV